MAQWCAIIGCLLCVLVPTVTSIGGRTANPRILTDDGNLIIQSGLNKNISFDVGDQNDVIFYKSSLKTVLKTLQKHEKQIGTGGGRKACQNGGRPITENGVSFCKCTGDWFGVGCMHKKPKSCHFEISTSVGIISSPGYPFAYPPNTECSWKIKAAPLHNIEVFVMSLGIGMYSGKCGVSDYLQVTDNVELNRKLCGEKSSFSLVGGNEMTLAFKTGPNRPVGAGFTLVFSQQMNKVCGGTLKTASGTLESPEHDKPILCEWSITPKSTENLKLRFDVMNIANEAGSCKNYLDIFAGMDSGAPLVRKVCHNTGPLTFNLPSSKAYVRYVSSDSSSRFQGSYQTICGGSNYLESGTLEVKSPSYPEVYPNKKTCTWTIKAPLGSTLAVRFLEFHVEPHPKCSYDNVAVYDGKSTAATQLANYCGNKTPLPVITTGENLVILFQSDGDKDFRGFRARVDVVKPGCGGIFTGHKGAFASPPPSITGACLYTISSDKPDQVIELSFPALKIKSTTDCKNEYIQIFHGITDNGTTPDKVCSLLTSPQPVVISDQRSMTLKFYSSNRTAPSEFTGEWKSIAKTAGCNIVANTPSGSVQSPGFPNKYSPNQDCTFVIKAEVGHLIQLSFDTFDLEQYSDCSNDYLKIYDGEDAQSPLLGTYCGANSPRNFVSSSDMLFMHFKTDSTGEEKGFKASYVTGTNLCGGFLRQNNGFISSPNFPNNYLANQDCVWQIQADGVKGTTLDLSIIEFSLEGSGSTCGSSNDYVRIYDGDNRGSKLIAELCGDKAPKTRFLSSTDKLMIEFKSNGDVQRKGFQFYFRTGCSHKLTARSGVIRSPNYPNHYPLSRQCQWSIQGGVNDVISLQTMSFNMQPSPNCVADYLQLNADQHHSQKYCGTLGPNERINSSSTDVIFHSDSRVTAKGFEIKYQILGCTGNLNGESGTFETPRYPLRFPPGSECRWYITVPVGKKIKLEIPGMSLGSCMNNSVKVYNGADEKAPLITTYCNQLSKRIILMSSGQQMTIVFTGGVAGVGFSGTYHAVEGGCGGIITLPESFTSGDISSPGFPTSYPGSTECDWKIFAPFGKNIKFTFVELDLEKSRDCSKDYVVAKDLTTYQTIGQYCGLDLPRVQGSSSEKLLIKFISDSGTTSNKGFKIKFELGCGGTIRIGNDTSSPIDTGVISTPNFPAKYAKELCIWHLIAPPGQKVFLKFDAFELEGVGSNGACTNDYVQMYNGDGTQGPLLSTLCGTNKPEYVVSSGNSLYIKFDSNEVNHFTGFKAEYSSLHTGCGGHLRGSKGSIANGLFPSKLKNAECEYHIYVPAGNKIALTFDIVDIPSDDQCEDNFIKVVDEDSITVHTCGTTRPADYKSKGEIIKIIFNAVNNPGSRFKIDYRTDCQNTFMTRSGYIKSPNSPQNYPSNSNCMYTIMAPPHINIRLQFEEFDLQEKVNGVCKDYVQIYDQNWKTLGMYCGGQAPPVMTSKGQSFKLRFVSDGSFNRPGFALKHMYTSDPHASCGGTFTATSTPGYITTPNYPHNYPNDQTCDYQIESIPGTSIKLTFIAFVVEAYFCFYDYVNVYDGAMDFGSKMATLCDTEGYNKTFHSTGSKLFLSFISDDDGTYPGFKAKFERVCGGQLTATKGNIASPTTSGVYSPSENCTWIIKQVPGSVVKLSFSKFGLERSDNCTKDYVLVRNGQTFDSPVIGRFCGGDIPSNYVSTGPTVLVQFVSDGETGGIGFEATYERVVHGCGGTFSLDDPLITSTLTSPGYPNSYPDNIDCEWFLTVPEGHVVDLEIQQFNSNFSCTSDYLEIHTGPTKQYHQIGKFCGGNLPHEKHYKSGTNGMYVRLRTGVKPAGKKGMFKAVWKIGCGGYIVASSGVISSPSFPSPYPTNQNCTFRVQTALNKQVHLQFNTFDLHQDNADSTTCPDDGDYVEVFDHDHNRSKVGRYCGNKLPVPIVSLRKSLTLRFISNAKDGGNGFQARFDTVGEECGGTLQDKGTFQTPFYPLAYPIRRECIWSLHSTSGIAIQLKFEKFDLESTTNCTGDRVVIRNGRYFWGDYLSPVIGTYCGSNIPSTIRSSGNHLTVIFISDGSSARGTGFKASFDSSGIGCGREVSGESGVITSPDYPANYPINQECEWKITVTPGRSINITLDAMQLEQPFLGMCFDYVELKDNGNVVARKCGLQAGRKYKYTSYGNTLSVKFTSDDADSAPGFKLSWKAVQRSCYDVTVLPRTGEIKSPSYPGYRSNLDCSWIFKKGEGETITLHLLDIDISSSCAEESIIIRNGVEPDSPILATLCGNQNTSDSKLFTSSGPHMKVTFITSAKTPAVGKRGFKIGFATRKAGCGGVLRGHNGTITSPDYPKDYGSFVDCTWVIQTAIGSRIFLYVDDLDMEDHSRCQYDAVDIRDGFAPTSPLISHLCGRQHDSVFRSSSNYMFITFRTDLFGFGRGFKLHYNTGCGGVMKGRRGFAISPNYPNQYPNNLDCQWTIQLAREYHVKLTQLEFDLPPHNEIAQCDKDHVELRDGLNVSAPLIATFCGAMENQQYESRYNQLLVRFVSDGITDPNRSYKGSKAHYEAVCGERIVTDKDGILKYPTSEDLYAKNESCVWVIEFPKNEKIVVNTKMIEIEAFRNFHCVYDYLEIRDGQDESAPMVGRFCGKAKPPVFTTSSNYLYVKFLSDPSLQQKGFEIHYSKNEPARLCGGVLAAPSGNITSPGYPALFPKNLDCGWRIEAPLGSRINITLRMFQLSIPVTNFGNYRDCKNYIVIYDAPYPDDHFRRMNFTCGTKTGFTFLSLSNSAYVHFHSYEKPGSTGDGFVIDYSAHSTGCGESISLQLGAERTITSPGYPANITEGTSCKWLIIAPLGNQVHMTFEEINFPALADGSCPSTHLQIFDGLRRHSLSICGGDVIGKMLQTSMHNTQLILNRGGTGNPFKINLKLVKGCNQTITASNGLITTPNFPFKYISSARCHYFLQAPAGKKITLYPVRFNLEAGGAECKFDALEINDGADRFATKLGSSYCGTTRPPTLTSSADRMHMFFKSDKGIAESGFAFSYTMTTSGCGGDMSGYIGAITSPKYPDLYDGQYDCEWNIRVSPGMKLNLTITNFELESPVQQGDCTTADYLEIFDGSVSLGKFCGQTHMSQKTTTSNTAKIIFKSNNVDNKYRGFSMFYRETL